MHSLTGLEPYCGEYCFESWGEYNSQRRAYGTIVLTVQFIIPLLIITICYTAISIRLGQSLLLKRGKKLTMTDQRKFFRQFLTNYCFLEIKANKRRQRTNRMFIAMVIAFSLSWVWSVLFNVFNDYKMLPKFIKDQEYLFGITTHCLSMSSTVSIFWTSLSLNILGMESNFVLIFQLPIASRFYSVDAGVYQTILRQWRRRVL